MDVKIGWKWNYWDRVHQKCLQTDEPNLDHERKVHGHHRGIR